MLKRLLFLVGILLSSGAVADDSVARILLPLGFFTKQPGAFGSLWTSSITGRTEQLAVTITQVPFGGGCISSCVTSAFSTFRSDVGSANINQGAFVYVLPGSAVDTVSFTLRIQDESRQALTWGTTIPVVRERDVRSGTLELLDVPLDARFRVALRIYDFDSVRDTAVRVRIAYPDPPYDSNPVVDVILPFIRPSQQSSTEFPAVPSNIFIGNIYDRFPELMASAPPYIAGAARLRIQIDPATPGLRFWAFASVTNDDTQHVTVITPK